MNKFELSVTEVASKFEGESNTEHVSAAGSLALIAYAATDVASVLADAKDGTRFEVKLYGGKTEAETILLDLTTDGDTVLTVLRDKVRKLRKAAREASAAGATE